MTRQKLKILIAVLIIAAGTIIVANVIPVVSAQIPPPPQDQGGLSQMMLPPQSSQSMQDTVDEMEMTAGSNALLFRLVGASLHCPGVTNPTTVDFGRGNDIMILDPNDDLAFVSTELLTPVSSGHSSKMHMLKGSIDNGAFHIQGLMTAPSTFCGVSNDAYTHHHIDIMGMCDGSEAVVMIDHGWANVTATGSQIHAACVT